MRVIDLTNKSQAIYTSEVDAKSSTEFGDSNYTGDNNAPINSCAFFYALFMTGGYWDTLRYAVSCMRFANPIFTCHPHIGDDLTGSLIYTGDYHV